MNSPDPNTPFTIDMPVETSSAGREVDTYFLDTLIFAGLIAALCIPVLCFGATEVWSQAIQVALVVSVLALCGYRAFLRREIRIPSLSFVVPGAIFICFVTIQYFANRGTTDVASIISIGTAAAIAMIVEDFAGRRRKQKALLVCLASFGFLLAILSIVLSLAEESPEKLLGFRTIHVTSASIFGPYVNHNHYAGLMEMLAPLAFAAAWLEVYGKRVLLIFGGLVMAASVVLSRSRGGVIAIAVGLMFVCAMLFRSQRSQRSLFTLLVICALLVGLVFSFASDKTIQRFKEGPDQYRASIYRDSLRMFLHRPLFGYGLGTFESNFPPYQSFQSDLAVNHAHNDYLEFLVETGIVGFGLLLWILVCIFRSARIKMRERHDTEGCIVTLGALTGIVCLLTHSFLDFNLQIPANMAIFAALCGLVATPFAHRIRYVPTPVVEDGEDSFGSDDEF